MKLTYIDSLRGVAILMVVLVHVAQGVRFYLSQHNAREISFIADEISRYGQMGVQLFFMVSAYTLCLSMTRRHEEKQKHVKFFIRRIFRIAPLYYFGIVIYAIYGVLESVRRTGEILFPEHFTLQNVAANVFFVHGFYPPANVSIVPGGWTIATEMTFYCLFPLLFVVANRIVSWSYQLILVLVAVLIAGNFFLLQAAEYWYDINLGNNSFIYNSIINQLPVFLIGMGWFFYQQNHSRQSWPWWVDAVFFGLFSVLSMMCWYLPWAYAFYVIPICSGVSYVFLFQVFRKKESFNSWFIMKVGQLSYSMYILHFLVTYPVSSKLSSLIIPYMTADLVLVFCFILVTLLSMLSAAVSERWIERPGINAGRALIRKIRVESRGS